MCGIAGYLGKTSYPYNCLDEMAKAINHRGPDDRGTWSDEDDGIGLAHARLSILDLSSAGHQPSFSRWQRGKTNARAHPGQYCCHPTTQRRRDC